MLAASHLDYKKVKPNLTWRIMDVSSIPFHCRRHGHVDIADKKTAQSTETDVQKKVHKNVQNVIFVNYLYIKD